MFLSSHRWWLRRGPRLRPGIPVLLVALVVAALAGADLVQYAAAQPGTRTPAGDATPESFAAACVQSGGSPLEIRDANGDVISSSCEYRGGGFSECDWIDRTCTYGFRTQPPSNPLQDNLPGGDTGGVLVEDTPTPTPSGPVLTEDTPVPTATADPTMEATETAVATAEATTAADATGTTTAEATGTPGSRTIRGESTGAPSAGPGSLTLIVATCEPDYDLFAPDADPEQECIESANGLAFLLDGPGVQTARIAGQDGPDTATFADLPDGTYRLRPMLPPATAFAFIFSCESDVRSLDDGLFTPLALVMPNGAVGLTLQPGENLTCAWFDVEAAPLVRQ